MEGKQLGNGEALDTAHLFRAKTETSGRRRKPEIAKLVDFGNGNNLSLECFQARLVFEWKIMGQPMRNGEDFHAISNGNRRSVRIHRSERTTVCHEKTGPFSGISRREIARDAQRQGLVAVEGRDRYLCFECWRVGSAVCVLLCSCFFYWSAKAD